MKPFYEGNDTYTFSLSTGKDITLTTSELSEIVDSSENYKDLQFNYNESLDDKKQILYDIEKGLEVLSQMESKINEIKRTRIKEELLSLHEEIDNLIGQWI